MLRHSSATYWAPKMNRYQLCAKYGWAFKSNMPDRYIERKGIIFDQIAEKGDEDQTTSLQKENRQLMEKVEMLEQDYNIRQITHYDRNHAHRLMIELMRENPAVKQEGEKRWARYAYLM